MLQQRGLKIKKIYKINKSIFYNSRYITHFLLKNLYNMKIFIYIYIFIMFDNVHCNLLLNIEKAISLRLTNSSVNVLTYNKGII